MKPSILTLLIILLALAAHAQDKIYKKDGTIISAKIITVGKAWITYKPFADTTGDEHKMLVADVGEIVYRNHTVDFFDTFGDLSDHSQTRKPSDTSHANRNIFALAPMAFTSALNGTINDPGIGISYERLFGHDGHFGLNIPLLVASSPAKDFSSYSYLSYNSQVHYKALYFMPGVKFYPAPDDAKVRFSAGASFFCIFGGEPEVLYLNNSNPVYNPATGTYTYPNETGTYHYAMYGLMVSNSVNITVVKHLYISAQISAGFPLSDNRGIAGTTTGLSGIANDPFVQIDAKFGYRF